MKKSLLICLFLLVACSTVDFQEDDVIALLNGEKIQAKNVYTLYSLDESGIERYLKEEVMIHDAKNKNILLTDQEIEEWKQQRFPGYDQVEVNERMELFNNKDFFEERASNLGISTETFFEIWFDEHFKREAISKKYLEELFPLSLENEISQEELDDWWHDVQQAIDELYHSSIENNTLILSHS